MAQVSEDEVWEQIIANANSLQFPEWEGFPEDPQWADEEIVDDIYCNCDNRQEVAQQISKDVFYVCSKSRGGCGKEIKK